MDDPTQNPPTDSTVNPDAPDDLARLEGLISADEAEMTERQSQRSSSKGQNGSAKDGPRAGQQKRQTPEVISARDGQRTGTGAADGKPPAAAPAPGTAKPSEKDEKDLKDSKDEKEDEANLSPYQKAKRREAKAWEKINESKGELDVREKALQAREKALAQRNGNGNGNGAGGGRPAGPVKDAAGYTRDQYERYAGVWERNAQAAEAQAREAEASGDYDAADRHTAKAAHERALAVAARQKAAGMPAGEPEAAREDARPTGNGDVEAEHRRAWGQIKADLPEVFAPGSPLNKALIEFIEKNGNVLDTPDGVYRAVIQTGRQMVAKLEREAARLPELTAANAALTEKVKGLEAELARLTSLPGGEALNRGGPIGKSFGEMSTKEQEAVLEAEILGR